MGPELIGGGTHVEKPLLFLSNLNFSHQSGHCNSQQLLQNLSLEDCSRTKEYDDILIQN